MDPACQSVDSVYQPRPHRVRCRCRMGPAAREVFNLVLALSTALASNSMAKTSPGAVLHRVHRKSATDHLQSRADLGVGPTIGVPSLAIKPCREPCFPHHQERNRDRMECHRRWTTPRVGADRGSEEGPAAKVPVVRTSLGLGVIVAVFPPGIAGMPGP